MGGNRAISESQGNDLVTGFAVEPDEADDPLRPDWATICRWIDEQRGTEPRNTPEGARPE